jgi:DNA-binding NarL/FixJ family response regulator
MGSPLHEHILNLLGQYAGDDDALSAALRILLRTSPLTPRQREFAELLLEGCGTKEMAARMKICERTVKQCAAQMYRRYDVVGVGSRVRLLLALALDRKRVKGEAFPQATPATVSIVARNMYGSTALTEKELRIARAVWMGLSNRMVGQEMGNSEGTIKNYLRAIYDKLGLWNRVELALWYEAGAEKAGGPPASNRA